MLLTRKNLKGGRKLKEFPLVEEQGIIGYKLGYCCNCNEQLLLALRDSQEVLAHLFYSQKNYKKLIEKLKPKFSLKIRLAKWIIDKLGEPPVDIPVYN